jgi:hypothetical protein
MRIVPVLHECDDACGWQCLRAGPRWPSSHHLADAIATPPQPHPPCSPSSCTCAACLCPTPTSTGGVRGRSVASCAAPSTPRTVQWPRRAGPPPRPRTAARPPPPAAPAGAAPPWPKPGQRARPHCRPLPLRPAPRTSRAPAPLCPCAPCWPPPGAAGSRAAGLGALLRTGPSLPSRAASRGHVPREDGGGGLGPRLRPWQRNRGSGRRKWWGWAALCLESREGRLGWAVGPRREASVARPSTHEGPTSRTWLWGPAAERLCCERGHGTHRHLVGP